MIRVIIFRSSFSTRALSSVRSNCTFVDCASSRFQGQFLVFNMDEEMFLGWLQTEVPTMNADHRNDCFTSLKEWCANNL